MFVEWLHSNTGAEIQYCTTQFIQLDFHHMCDKPLEEPKEQTDAVSKLNSLYIENLLIPLSEFDIVILNVHMKELDKQYQESIVKWVKSGGKLIVANPSWEITYDETLLEQVMPVKSSSVKMWTYTQQGATDDPLVYGVKPLNFI